MILIIMINVRGVSDNFNKDMPHMKRTCNGSSFIVHGSSWVILQIIIKGVEVIVKERHETIMGYKPRERVALEWFIPIIVELLALPR